jgi:hypothetical protein
MDLLSYNTNKNSFLTNMLYTEAFLDSAQLRDSVFSQAKNLNYLPDSAFSSYANVTVNFTATGVSQPYVIPKGSSFSTLVKNSSYMFTTPETIIVSSANNSYTFTTQIFEGTYVQDAYIYDPTTLNPNPRFRITNPNVDLNSLTVVVSDYGSTNTVIYNLATSFLDLTNLSTVYFLQAAFGGYYEIIFGDDVIGNAPSNNATILMDYRICNATLPNGATTFSINFDPTGKANELINVGTGNPKVITNVGAQGGSNAESIESVRFYAPRYFQTQERAIVPSDYEVLLKKQFPEINAVNAYGGEDINPPQYGKVVVSVNISGVTSLPSSKQTQYTNFLKQRMPMSIQPIFVDPWFTYLQITTLVRYNVNITTNSVNYTQTLVNTTISNYNITNLNNFNVTLRLSQLSTLIDESDPSIISNQTSIKCYQKIIPNFGVTTNYTISFGFSLSGTLSDTDETHPSNIQTCLSSSSFMYNGSLAFLEDDGEGKVRISTSQNGENITIAVIGTINYSTGQIILNNFKIDSLINGQTLLVYVVPADDDVASSQNNILSIDLSSVNIVIEPISV